MKMNKKEFKEAMKKNARNNATLRAMPIEKKMAIEAMIERDMNRAAFEAEATEFIKNGKILHLMIH